MVPVLWMLAPLVADPVPWRLAIRPSGYAAVVLLVAALAIEPLFRVLPQSRLLFELRRRRRAVGLAAFAYGVIHVVVFSASIGRLDHILQGMAFASMWTGWLAFALMVPVAAISSDRAMRALGPWWKRLQRLVHPAAVLVLAHWLLLSRSPVEALAWFVPLALVQALRLFRARSKRDER